MQNTLTRVQVKKLFNKINYDIAINQNDPISIITAPNGCGKTTILNFICFIMNPDSKSFEAIQKTPFECFSCFFSGGQILTLKKESGIQQNSTKQQKHNGYMRSMDSFPAKINSFLDNGDFVLQLRKNDKSSELRFSQVLNDSFDVDPESFLESDEDSDYDALLKYKNLRRFEPIAAQAPYLWKTIKEFLTDSECIRPVHFIRADRIQPEITFDRRFDEPRKTSPLKNASADIGKRITIVTDKYNSAVSAAKDKLPQIFLGGEAIKLDLVDFQEEWLDYRDELEKFQDMGLISPSEDFIKGRATNKEYDRICDFLCAYLQAFRNTTSHLKDIYIKLKLFKDILDERNAITGKTVTVDKNGIHLNDKERVIDLETLSSGEKHDLIMFYNLIFNTAPGGLVLVDEPEISLHIEWQESYLDKLMEICKMNKLQAIVATHSPNIVGSHYDFLVEKGESYE